MDSDLTVYLVILAVALIGSRLAPDSVMTVIIIFGLGEILLAAILRKRR